jgi:hypothetical protein
VRERLSGHHFRAAAVHLQRANGGHQHRAVGLQPAVAALDVAEFFEAHVGAESGLGEHVAIGSNQLERDLIGDNRRIAVRDIGERSGVNERGRALDGLHQIGHDGVLHQDRQRAARADVVGGNRFAGVVAADHHAAQAIAHVGQVGRQRQDRHDLARHRDVESRDAREAFSSGPGRS